MAFQKILSAVLACSATINLFTGSISASAATGNITSVPTVTAIDCECCQEILQYREDLYEIIETLSKDPKNQELLDKRETYNTHVNSLLTHECNEETIYVENYPYAMYDYYGNYTGYWKGASPSGQGKYTAYSIKGTSTFDTNTQITTKKYYKYTYEGNWINGFANGEGADISETYITETPKSTGKEVITKYTSKSYQGEMKKQQKNGKGKEEEVLSNGNYILYEKGNYKEDALQGTVAFEEYNSSDKLLRSGTVREDKNGKKFIVKEDEKKSSKLKKGLLIAGAVIGGALLVDSLISDDDTSYDYESEQEAIRKNNEYWANYHAEQEAKRKKEEEEEAERVRKQQEWENNKYYYYKNTYGDDNAQTQQWKRWSGN